MEDTTFALPPCDQCEVVFIPSSRHPFLVYCEGNTIVDAMNSFVKEKSVKPSEITFAHGDLKDWLYNTFVRAHQDGKLCRKDFA